MPPGWYDDPWSPAALRWWDGTQWTPHAAPRPFATFGFLPPVGPADVVRVAEAGRRASIALAIGAVGVCAQYFLMATWLHSFLHQFFHQIKEYNDRLDADPNAQLQLHLHLSVLRVVTFYATSLVTLAVEIMLIVWLYQAANIAQRLGLPARRSPVWAILGFIVPIVNFWFPYQVAADLLPPADTRRRLAGAWWGFWLGQGFVTLPVLIVSFTSTTAAVVVACLGCVVAIMAAVNGRQMIAAVSDGHAALVNP